MAHKGIVASLKRRGLPIPRATTDDQRTGWPKAPTRRRERRSTAMTKTLGIIGSGMIGSTIARLAVTAGLDVVISNSRGPRTLQAQVADLGPQARAATPAEAARAADLVVAAVPLGAIGQLPADALAGKTVIDAMNHYPERDGGLLPLESGELTSSELVQHHLPGAHVVKALNNVFFAHLAVLARPAGAPDRSALPVAGDDPSAVAATVALLDVLGYDGVPFGTLADSWRTEPGTAVQAVPYAQAPATEPESWDWIFQAPAAPASAARIRALLDSAARTPAP
ncbi:NADPH-dependent F420 reductase [Kitasatospora albolonga]|uniref:NADPH-dependent F420 reductase n=1 Tax=Kitasatospora albolonga TaxID=68173 RepID=UPI0031EB06C3